MFFVGGIGSKTREHGGVIFVCFQCEQIRPFRILEHYGYAQAFGVRIDKHKVQYSLACASCEHGWELNRQQFEAAKRVERALDRIDRKQGIGTEEIAAAVLTLGVEVIPETGDLRPLLQEALPDLKDARTVKPWPI